MQRRSSQRSSQRSLDGAKLAECNPGSRPLLQPAQYANAIAPYASWIDAACVGEAGAAVSLDGMTPLHLRATGRGKYQVGRTDKYGFPRGAAGRVKRVHGFQTGDLARLCLPKGKYAGVHTGRIVGIRADGRFDLAALGGKITATYQRYTLLQRGDGYAYA